MIKRTTLLPILLGTLLLLGLPPALLVLTTYSDAAAPTEPAAQRSPIEPLKKLIARNSSLALVYDQWAKGYEARGGDRNVVLGLGWSRDFSSEWSPATGTVTLDLIAGKVAAEVKGLGDLEADLWLVDNDPDKSVRPQAGERMVRIGRLQKDGALARISRHPGPAAFHDFELDLAVVTRAGRTPVQGMVLLGTRSYFETVYTRARLITERQREQDRPSWAGFFRAGNLASLFRPRSADANSTQILIAHGLVGQDVGDGADLFFRGTFGGNGRTCATCHRAVNNLVIDAEFIATLDPATDKLFVASQPGGVPGLERPELLRQFGLILENVDGFENPTVKFVMRGVPHTESLNKSILKPNDTRVGADERTGWGGDGAPAPGTLTLFPDGAVKQHFTKSLLRREGIDFVLPTVTQENKMRAYMLATGRSQELVLSAVSLTNAGANAGRILFLDNAVAKCNRCHGNAGANVGNNTNVNFDTGVETVVHPARAVEDFPFDGGFGATPAAPCKGNPNRTCFGDATFNTPPLIEAADTEPFFHNNVIADVEGAVAFYDSLAFNTSAAADPNTGVGPIDLTLQQIQDIAAFLRVINASFNADIAIQRNTAAISLENSADAPNPCGAGVGTFCSPPDDDVNGKRDTINTLLALSNAEALDAIEVLTARSLHADAVKLFQSAISKNNSAINETASQKRKNLMTGAKNDLIAAKAKFGTGLNLGVLPDGNLLF